MDDEATVETGPIVEPTEAAPRRRSRAGIAMFVVAGVLLVGAVAFVFAGFQAQSKASDERDQTATAVARRHTLARAEQGFDTDRRELENEFLALPDKYSALGESFGAFEDAHFGFIEILDRSVVLYNQGDTPGSVQVLQAEGQTALDALMAKRTEAQQTVQVAEDALHQLQEAL